MGWDDRVGTLAPGRFADLVAVAGDPLAGHPRAGVAGRRGQGRPARRRPPGGLSRPSTRHETADRHDERRTCGGGLRRYHADAMPEGTAADPSTTRHGRDTSPGDGHQPGGEARAAARPQRHPRPPRARGAARRRHRPPADDHRRGRGLREEHARRARRPAAAAPPGTRSTRWTATSARFAAGVVATLRRLRPGAPRGPRRRRSRPRSTRATTRRRSNAARPPRRSSPTRSRTPARTSSCWSSTTPTRSTARPAPGASSRRSSGSPRTTSTCSSSRATTRRSASSACAPRARSRTSAAPRSRSRRDEIATLVATLLPAEVVPRDATRDRGGPDLRRDQRLARGGPADDRGPALAAPDGGRQAVLDRLQHPEGPLFAYLAEEVIAAPRRRRSAPPSPVRRASTGSPGQLLEAAGVDRRAADPRRPGAAAGCSSSGLPEDPGWFVLHGLIRDFARANLPLDPAATSRRSTVGPPSGWRRRTASTTRSPSSCGRADQERIAAFLSTATRPRWSSPAATRAGDRGSRGAARRGANRACRPGVWRGLHGPRRLAQRDRARSRAPRPAASRLDPQTAWRLGLVHGLRGAYDQALEIYARAELSGRRAGRGGDAVRLDRVRALPPGRRGRERRSASPRARSGAGPRRGRRASPVRPPTPPRA